MEQIERLRAMAQEAVAEYQSVLRAGGEPNYPQWADDILHVCELAALGLQFQELAGGPAMALQAQRRASMEQ
jgi:hypothetical protein